MCIGIGHWSGNDYQRMVKCSSALKAQCLLPPRFSVEKYGFHKIIMKSRRDGATICMLNPIISV